MILQERVPLAPRTTLGIGGPARWLVEARSEAEVGQALAWADDNGVAAFVLGGGSNLVVSDAGVDGLVLQARIEGVRFDDGARATAGAGEDWNDFVDACVAQGWAGVECLAGIPGRVGGAPIQNIGAYGQEVAETIQTVRAWDRAAREAVELSAAECGFGYRSSRFNGADSGRFVVLSVTFALYPGAAPTLRYPELRRHFEQGEAPTLRAVFDAVRQIRGRKGMLAGTDDPDARSAGSFFKNPTVAATEFERVRAAWTGEGEIPHFPQPDGTIKIPAAWLIERSGTGRGERFGPVAVSSRHVLALTNAGGATAADLIVAARAIQERVRQRWGLLLVPEPVFLGFAPEEILPDGAK